MEKMASGPAGHLYLTGDKPSGNSSAERDRDELRRSSKTGLRPFDMRLRGHT